MPIYMNYNKIPGDVTADGHEAWVELNSFGFMVGRTITSPVGASADRESSAPTIGEISVTKDSDVSSSKLFTESLQGEGQTVQIDFCKTDKGDMEVYNTYILTNCMISGFSVSSGGGRPSESLTLSFTKVELKVVEMTASGDASSPRSVVYDLGLAKIV
jgi:type VI secretion system secreted protein Hcp